MLAESSRMFRFVLVPVLAAVLLAALVAPGVARADDEVVIDGTGVRPNVLRTTTAHRVLFVNRSGHIARVKFTGGPNAQRVIVVPVQLWVYFDHPGRHPYVVRLGTGHTAVTLQGVIQVEKEEGKPDLPTCDSEMLPGGRVMGECIVW